MRVVHLIAENFKKLKVVSITPKGNVVKITGANGQGKSSVLDAIWACLRGAEATPAVPVRTGAVKSNITLNLGDLIVTRKFNASGTTSLVVTNADGAKYPSPQSVLDKLVAGLGFDPYSFLRLKPAQQLDYLRKLVPLDVDIDQINAQNKIAYDERTILNRQAKLQENVATSIAVPSDAPLKPVDIDSIQDQIAEASEINDAIAAEVASRQSQRDAVTQARVNAQRYTNEAAALRKKLTEVLGKAAVANAEAVEIEESLNNMDPVDPQVDTRALSAQLDAALAANEAYNARQRRKEASAAHDKLVTQAQALTDAIDAREGLKQTAISRAKMPVAGLSFGDGEVLFNGLPLAQAAKSAQLRISTAIAAALNPTLRVILIHDGSLIDASGMTVLEEFAAKENMQVWIELVDPSGKVGVVLEEGEVVADHQVG